MPSNSADLVPLSVVEVPYYLVLAKLSKVEMDKDITAAFVRVV